MPDDNAYNSGMTQPAEDVQSDVTVHVSLSLADADSYLTYARRPAMPVVKSIIARAFNSLTAMDSRCEFDLTRQQAEDFIRKSTRPTRLPSGQTLRSLVSNALDAVLNPLPERTVESTSDDDDDIDFERDVLGMSDETEVPRSASDTPLSDYELGGPADAPLDVHSEDPDQEPTPVAVESDDWGPVSEPEDEDLADRIEQERQDFEGTAGEVDNGQTEPSPEFTGDALDRTMDSQPFTGHSE